MSRFKALTRLYRILMRRTEVVDLNELEATGRLDVGLGSLTGRDPSQEPLELQGLWQEVRELAARSVAGSLSRFSRLAPQLGSAILASVFGAFLIADVVRAVVAPVLAALPMWRADLSSYLNEPLGFELVFVVGLLTVVGWALIPRYRRECAVVGALLTGLVMPAGFGLSWPATLTVFILLTLVLLATGFIGANAVLGWDVAAMRVVTMQLSASAVAGAAAIAVALARPWSTAAVLAAVTVIGMALSTVDRWAPEPLPTRPRRWVTTYDRQVAAWMRLADASRGAAVFAAPGAVIAGLMTLLPGRDTSAALTAGFLTASVAFALVAWRLAMRKRVGVPLYASTVLCGLTVAVAAIATNDTDLLDVAVGILLLVAAVVLALVPIVDRHRRLDWMLRGADIAASAVTGTIIALLARMAHLINPDQWMLPSALAILAVAIAIRGLPDERRSGPAVGLVVAGAVIGLIIGYHTLLGGWRVLAIMGELWSNRVPDIAAASSRSGWQAPAALVVLAIAAAVALPRPLGYRASAAAIVLATIGIPAAMGWAWWAAIILGVTVAALYSVAAAIAVDHRAGYARLAVAFAVGVHALLASLVMLWTTAATLAMLALIVAVAAELSAAIARLSASELLLPPRHLEVMRDTGRAGSLILIVAAAFAAEGTAAAQPIPTLALLLAFGLADASARLVLVLATSGMSIVTATGAAIAAFSMAWRGKTALARTLGWLIGALAAQLLVLAVSLKFDAPPRWAAFAVLTLGAALITIAVLLPRLNLPRSVYETTSLEGAGYASALVAVALASRSALDLAAILIGGSCLLCMSAIHDWRTEWQRPLFYTAGSAAAIALWLLLFHAGSPRWPLPEGLILPFAIVALVVGLLQARRRPELRSWAAYGPALIAVFGATVVMMVVSEPDPLRVIALLAGGSAVLVWGRRRMQRAPVAVGAVVTVVAVVAALQMAGIVWLVPGLIGTAMLLFGARWEYRRRIRERFRKLR